MTLKIEKELFQWEKGRYVLVNLGKNDPAVSCVQFYNKKSKVASEIDIENGKAQIPNHLLKESLPIVALACTEDENGTQVITRKVFKVLARVKPEYYVDDDPIIPDEPDTTIEIIYDGGIEV